MCNHKVEGVFLWLSGCENFSGPLRNMPFKWEHSTSIPARHKPEILIWSYLLSGYCYNTRIRRKHSNNTRGKCTEKHDLTLDARSFSQTQSAMLFCFSFTPKQFCEVNSIMFSLPNLIYKMATVLLGSIKNSISISISGF